MGNWTASESLGQRSKSSCPWLEKINHVKTLLSWGYKIIWLWTDVSTWTPTFSRSIGQKSGSLWHECYKPNLNIWWWPLRLWKLNFTEMSTAMSTWYSSISRSLGQKSLWLWMLKQSWCIKWGSYKTRALNIIELLSAMSIWTRTLSESLGHDRIDINC